MPRNTIIGAGRCALEASSRRLVTAYPSPSQARAFSSTAARNAHIQSFTPSSTPEIDAILDKIRRKIILPAYLSHRERKQLNSPRYQKKLQSDPIIMEIDEEIYKFYYLNPVGGGVPNSEKTAMMAIDKFRTAEDFANVRPLLEGLQVAGRTLSVAFWTKLARVAGTRGYIYEILDCARSVKSTGYKLDTSEKVNEILHFFQLKAVDAGWDKAETGQAFRWAKMLYEMLPAEEHQPEPVKLPGGRVAPRVGVPLDRDPQVVMAPLHLAAALVVKCGVESESLKEAVADYARDLVKLWPTDRSLRSFHPAEAYADHDRMGYLNDPNKFLALVAPLLHGLELAAQAVPDPALAKELTARFEILSAEVEQARLGALEHGKRGDVVYKKFYPA